MRAEVTEDQTIRTITITVQGAPDIDTTQPWHREPQICRPDWAILTVVDGQPTVIEVFGWRVLKTGIASTRLRGQLEWQAEGPREREQIGSAPEWVRLIWDEAPTGVTTWEMPEVPA